MKIGGTLRHETISQVIKLMLALVIIADLAQAGPPRGVRKFRFVNSGASMPVIVRGNLQSDALLVFIHGGPGGSATLKIGQRSFEILEKEYRVVYWNQRGSDNSRGGTHRRYMNIGQFVEDLDALVDLLTRDYPGMSLFLMGHSWGGCLATAYLVDPTRQAKISGWVDVSGAHNNPRGDSLSMTWVTEHARRRIVNGQGRLYWKYALRWYEKNPGFSSANLMHYQFVRRANGYVYSRHADRLPGYSTRNWIMSPWVPIRYYWNYRRTLSRLIISEIDLTPAMREVTLPTLIIWGREDGVVPFQVASEAYANLGTPASDKSLVILNNTAHTVYYEQPQLFTQYILTFVDIVMTKENPALRIANKNLN